MKNDQDSSEMGNEETKNFMKKDVMLDINVNDKIFIKGGDLQGTIGNIINFEKNGQGVVFKPTNLEDFSDHLGVER